MTRPEKIACETCGMWAEQHPLGALRRFCDDCTRAKSRARNVAWKQANPDRMRQLNRESARRRRRDGRLT